MATKASGLSKRIIGRVLCLTPLLALGCGTGFDSPDVVKTLRVLGVQKDYPYAAPTNDPANPSVVKLTMLDYDGTQSSTGVQRLWFSGCDDLPGDQYFTCLARMYVLWTTYDNPPKNVTRPELQDGVIWSPLDYIMADPSLQTDDDRMKAAQALVSQVKPDFPLELAESYLGTFRIGSGPRFVYPIPPLIVENHQPSSDPAIPPYGLSFIFFTDCTGHIEIAPNWQNVDIATTLHNATLGFPFMCVDDKGNEVGPEGFVAGYTQQFVYGDGTANYNPVISGVSLIGPGITHADADAGAGADAGTYSDSDAGASAAAGANADSDAGASAGVGINANAYCIDESCVPPSLTPDPCKDPQSPTISACSGNCPTYEFSPTMTAAQNNDVDLFATDERGGSPVGEQMWINYYTDAGSLNRAVKLLRDASQGWAADGSLGWADDHSVTWTAPSTPGPANLWAVAHDSRGGTSWVWLRVCVQ